MAKAAREAPRIDDRRETDLSGWIQARADRLRARRLDARDPERPITHRPRGRDQPGLRSSLRRGTIGERRDAAAGLPDAGPSLRRDPGDVFARCDRTGRREAPDQTGIGFTRCPQQPPLTIGRTLIDGLPPKEPDRLVQA